MQLLTLNTHSWQEENQEEKMESIVAAILNWDSDYICFQEANQRHDAEVATELPGYLEVEKQFNVPVKKDNFIKIIAEKLLAAGSTYYWSWVPINIAFDQYDEGVGILAKKPFQPHDLALSEIQDFNNYRTRHALLAEFDHLNLISTHFSWWYDDREDLAFAHEWQQVMPYLKTDKPSLIAGDFNNPANEKDMGYDYIQKTMPTLHDSWHSAKQTSGDITMGGEIDGWIGQAEGKRIDFIFGNETIHFDSHEVVFSPNHPPIVSDHYGIHAVFSII